jgi:hypothetical protein
MDHVLHKYTVFIQNTDMLCQLLPLFVLGVPVWNRTGNFGPRWIKRMRGGWKWLLAQVRSQALSSNSLFPYPEWVGNAEQTMTTDRAFTTTND